MYKLSSSLKGLQSGISMSLPFDDLDQISLNDNSRASASASAAANAFSFFNSLILVSNSFFSQLAAAVAIHLFLLI